MLALLPAELLAAVLAELDIPDLITAAQLCTRIRAVSADTTLNPWRAPIVRALQTGRHPDALQHLSAHSTVPTHNWVDILALARPAFILFHLSLPRLSADHWRTALARRFLPSWRHPLIHLSQKESFLRLLYRVWHRPLTSCTADESWTRYILLNRNGSACELQTTSRNFNPLTIFDEIKHQTNLAHLATRVRVVLELADVRIVAFGCQSYASPLTSNPNARAFLHPPGIGNSGGAAPQQNISLNRDTYSRLLYPSPHPRYANYPFYTPGVSDDRWVGSGDKEEGGLHWVGGMIIVAQLLSHDRSPILQYASFSWNDLWSWNWCLKEALLTISLEIAPCSLALLSFIGWTDSMSHACRTCSASFHSEPELAHHSTQCRKRRGHVCLVKGCGKVFAQSSGLKAHENVHTKKKPYVCGFGGCRSAFGDPSSKARHIKEIHKTTYVNECPVSSCKTKIKRRSAFHAHLKRKHGITDVEAAVPLRQPPSKYPPADPLQCPTLRWPSISPQAILTYQTGDCALYSRTSTMPQESALAIDPRMIQAPNNFVYRSTPTYGRDTYAAGPSLWQYGAQALWDVAY
ncbi:hypothetical protein APHAL10511_001693 [Amanita phalloides]|nr:hypothetical protein APHAL10511_001693 [Amanita phalloides]